MDLSIEHIRSLVELMAANDLSRIELRDGEAHILLRRGQPLLAAAAQLAPMAPMAAQAPLAIAPAAPAAAPAGEAGPAATTPPSESESFIRSPMVGTFYSSPDPESPAFVSVGSAVSPDTVVCLVEAMKVFNEIKAECSGRVLRVLVKNGQAVEYDQPLFAVTPS